MSHASVRADSDLRESLLSDEQMALALVLRQIGAGVDESEEDVSGYRVLDGLTYHLMRPIDVDELMRQVMEQK